eukprot:8090871-Lingulodinium_polyedra.AAC.1
MLPIEQDVHERPGAMLRVAPPAWLDNGAHLCVSRLSTARAVLQPELSPHLEAVAVDLQPGQGLRLASRGLRQQAEQVPRDALHLC